MKQFKEYALFFAATLLYQVAALLFTAVQKEHLKTCPNHAKQRRDHEHHVN